MRGKAGRETIGRDLSSNAGREEHPSPAAAPTRPARHRRAQPRRGAQLHLRQAGALRRRDEAGGQGHARVQKRQQRLHQHHLFQCAPRRRGFWSRSRLSTCHRCVAAARPHPHHWIAHCFISFINHAVFRYISRSTVERIIMYLFLNVHARQFTCI